MKSSPEWMALLAGLVLVALPAPSAGEQQPGAARIEVLEPASWSGPAARSIQVVPRNSLRVVGLASDPSGIGKVLVAGVPASLSPDGEGRVRFTAYARVEEGTGAIEVTAFPMMGPPVTRAFGIEPVGIRPGAPGPGREASAGGRPAVESSFGGERWAVVVGVGQYRDGRIPALRYADADARALHDFLLSEGAGMGGFAPERVRLLLNEEATERNIRSALLTWLRAATDDDLVVIYFAGHGAPDPARLQDHYLLAWDTDLDDMPATALLMDDVSDAIRRVYHRHLVFIADACHSAGLGGQSGTRALSVNAVNNAFLDQIRSTTGGQVIFTASQVNQLSREDARWGGGHGVFTWYLLEGLRGRADEDRDGVVTLGETMEFVRDAVRRETRNAQIPTISQTSFDWYLPLAVTDPAGPRAAEPAPVPADAPAPREQDRLPEPRPAAPAASRGASRVGVTVQLDAVLEGAGSESLARLLRAEVENGLRAAGITVSDLTSDPAGAEVVVEVAAILADQGESGGLRSAGLELTLTAREQGGAVTMAAAQGRANGAGLSPVAAGRAALQRGVPPVVSELAGELQQAWRSQQEDGFLIRVLVSGLEGYGQVIWLTENLGRAVSVSAGVVERGADLQAGTAELEWIVPLPAPEVARALESHRFEGNAIEVVRVAAGLLELRVTARREDS